MGSGNAMSNTMHVNTSTSIQITYLVQSVETVNNALFAENSTAQEEDLSEQNLKENEKVFEIKSKEKDKKIEKKENTIKNVKKKTSSSSKKERNQIQYQQKQQEQKLNQKQANQAFAPSSTQNTLQGKGLGSGSNDALGLGDAPENIGSGSGLASSSVFSKIKYLKIPPYPELSRQAGEEGKSEIRVEIEEGKLIKAELFTSSAFSRLDKAALKAVKKARFASFTGTLIIPIIFTLEK